MAPPLTRPKVEITSGSLSYKAFISYSHEADTQLASLLQRAVQSVATGANVTPTKRCNASRKPLRPRLQDTPADWRARPRRRARIPRAPIRRRR
jgi:hypothetical protein